MASRILIAEVTYLFPFSSLPQGSREREEGEEAAQVRALAVAT